MDKDRYSIDDLLQIMRRLRAPEGGCPWDIEQDFNSIAPYTIEEAYEVAEAIDHGDMGQLRDELGDLLFQVVFHAQMATENGDFSFDDVVQAVCKKMVRRHPHVFADADIKDAAAQTKAWEAQKANERRSKPTKGDIPLSVLDDVPLALPALLRALKLQKRAARVGFDWDNIDDVMAKMREEVIEVGDALAAKGPNSPEVLEEFGDLMFVCANLARHLQLDPENALRLANLKFERRFKGIENLSQREGKELSDLNLDEMEALWNAIKANELKISEKP